MKNIVSTGNQNIQFQGFSINSLSNGSFALYFQKLLSIRNIVVNELEKLFFGMNVLLGLLAWIVFGTGMSFILSPQVSNGQFEMKTMKGQIAILLLFYLIFLNVMAVAGSIIATKRDCPCLCLGLYGIFIFFFCSIPLYVEGDQMLKLSNLETDKLCQINEEDKEAQPKWVQRFIQFSDRFDLMSEVLLNEYMCTKTCPCLQYNDGKLSNPRKNPKLWYDMLDEKELNGNYRRTLNSPEYAKNHSLIPFLWTQNQSEGFKSFMECYELWEERAELSDAVDVDYVFYQSSSVYNKWHNPKPTGKVKRKNKSLFFFLSHIKEIEIFGLFEDEFDCSGMCSKSLFYFGRTMEDGPPKDTCLNHFHDAVAARGYPFAVFSVLTGTLCLLNLIVSLFMIFRPLPDKININENENEQQRDVEGNVYNAQVQGNNGNQFPINSSQSSQQHQPGPYIPEPIQLDESIEPSSFQSDFRENNQIEMADVKLDGLNVGEKQI